MLALRAEGIGVAVGLNAGAVRGGVEAWLAEASLSARVVNSGHSVLGRVARGAESRRGGAGETFRVALGAGSGEICVKQLIIAVHAGADGTGEVSEPGGIAAGASG